MTQPTISTDEVTNLLDALASAVEAANLEAPTAPGELRPLRVVVGWPRHDDLALPALSIDAGQVTRRHQPPRVVAVDAVPGSDPAEVDVTWAVEALSVVVNLDLWTANVIQRYKLKPELLALFRPDPDEPHGLRLVLVNSFDTVARVMWQDDTTRDADGDNDGIRRLAITARADLNRLVKARRLAASWQVNPEYMEP